MKFTMYNLKILRAKYWFMLLALLALAIVMFTVIQAVSAPSHGKITTSVDSKTRHGAPRQKQAVTPASDIDNQYFRLTLPPGYKQQSSSTDTPGLLYQQTVIKSSTSGSLIIAISLASLGSGLSDATAYNLRIRDSARYKMTSQTVHGEQIIIFNDVQTAAIAAFWVHADRLATISVSSGLQNPSDDDYNEEIKALKPLLTAWQWQ